MHATEATIELLNELPQVQLKTAKRADDLNRASSGDARERDFRTEAESEAWASRDVGAAGTGASFERG